MAEIVGFLRKKLENPNFAFGYLFAHLQSGNKQDVEEKTKDFGKKMTSNSSLFEIREDFVGKLKAGLELYKDASDEQGAVISRGFREMHGEILEATEAYAEELVYEVLQHESDVDKSNSFGWASNKDEIVKVAETLFEIQLLATNWEKAKELKKRRRSE